MQAADCAAACLAAVVRYHGGHLTTREARARCNVGREGARAGDVVRAARALNFEAHGVRADVDSLREAGLPLIAHLRGNHYVVVEQVRDAHVVVMDPAFGRRRFARDEFAARFSGVALRILPTAQVAVDRSLRHRLPLHVLRTYGDLLRELRGLVVAAMIASGVLQAAMLLTPFVVASVADPRGASLSAVLAVVAAAGAAFGLLAWLRGRLFLAVKVRHDAAVTTGLVRHMVGVTLEYFQSRSTADLLSRVTSTAAVRDALSTAVLTSFGDAAAAVLSLLVLTAVSPTLGLFALAVSAVLVIAPLIAYRFSRPHAMNQLEKRSSGAAKLLMLLLGIEQAKAHAAEHALVATWREVYDEELDAARRLGGVDVAVQTFTDTTRLVAGPLLVVLAQLVTGSPVLALGFGLSAAAFLGPVSNLVRTITSLVTVQAHLARMEDILEEPSELGEQVGRSRDPVALRVNSVAYSYPGAPEPAVVDARFMLLAGSVVLVTGPSGSGKSTLARVIAGLLRPTAGTLEFVRNDGEAVVPAIGYSAQTVALYPGTIESNIRFGRDTSRTELAEAIRGADLTEFVQSLRTGVDTPVVDSGHAFSGGQRQRIAIARALLGTPPVLVLDEATSNLDVASEERILEYVSRLPSTTILVGHRQQLLRFVDVVVFMQCGRVVAVGPHDVLTATVPAYAEHWSPDALARHHDQPAS